jgi:hypothetical protein
MTIEFGQLAGMRSGIRIVIMDRERLEVAHILNRRGERTGELILGKLYVV